MVVHSCWRIYFIVLSDLTKVQIYFKHILNGFGKMAWRKIIFKKNKTKENTSPPRPSFSSLPAAHPLALPRPSARSKPRFPLSAQMASQRAVLSLSLPWLASGSRAFGQRQVAPTSQCLQPFFLAWPSRTSHRDRAQSRLPRDLLPWSTTALL